MQTLIARFVLVLGLVMAPGSALALQVLSDDEMDQISAQGSFSLSIDPNGPTGVPTVNFGFVTGDTTGTGSVSISPLTAPSTIINGNALFSNTLFNVQNMIFNMNICVQCHATTLTQANIGVPVEIKFVP